MDDRIWREFEVIFYSNVWSYVGLFLIIFFVFLVVVFFAYDGSFTRIGLMLRNMAGKKNNDELTNKGGNDEDN